MSGPGRLPPRLQALTLRLDADMPVLEFQGWRTAERTRGCAILPWRGSWLEAREAGVRAAGTASEAGDGWNRALVVVQKGRAATESDLIEAWRRLAPGGQLLLLGLNDLGVATYAKRFAAAIDQGAELIASGGHGRLVRFLRTSHPGPEQRDLAPVPSDPGPGAVPLAMLPGVFSGDGLDLGCGAGHLGIACLRRWAACRTLFLDADARAVACTSGNLRALGLEERAEVRWWCERDGPPAAAAHDLVLVNPPCHAGSELDIFLAEVLLDIAGASLAPGGRLLVVANRRLPYEPMVARYGTLAPIAERGAFKILEVLRG